MDPNDANATSSSSNGVVDSSSADKEDEEQRDQQQENIKRHKAAAPSPPRPPRPSPLPFGVAASPPRYVALEEAIKAANCASNMYLAHEIAVEESFQLEKARERSALHKQFEDVMRQAFWDILQSQLEETPPKYKQALTLLAEIKGDLLSLLLPQHTKLKQEIDEILDIELIRQQAENGALDFQRYAQYILSVMARLCAPVRDEKIRELTQTSDVINLFR